jgi:hypothetical protein
MASAIKINNNPREVSEFLRTIFNGYNCLVNAQKAGS